MPFEQKSLGTTSFFALYLVKNNAPVHAFFISFLSLKRYYSLYYTLRVVTGERGLRYRVTFESCPWCEFVPKYLLLYPNS
jgi:hypothetical protein